MFIPAYVSSSVHSFSKDELRGRKNMLTRPTWFRYEIGAVTNKRAASGQSAALSVRLLAG